MSATRPTPRPVTRHELKLWADQFESLARGLKRADIRRSDDRDFRRFDELLFRQYTARNDRYSGRALLARVTHLACWAGFLELYGAEKRGLVTDGLMYPIVVLSIEVLEIGSYQNLRRTSILAVDAGGGTQTPGQEGRS